MKWAWLIVGGVLLILVVAVAGIVSFLPAERIGAIASARLEQQTGRTLSLSGDFSPSLWPSVGVSTGPFQISNADWASSEPMLSADSARLGVSLAALIAGRIEIVDLTLINPVLRVEIRQDGATNLQMIEAGAGSVAPDAVAAEGSDGGFGIASIAATLENGTLFYSDARDGTAHIIDRIAVSVALSAPDQPMTVQGSGRWNDQTIGLDASIDTLADVLAGARSRIVAGVTSDMLDASYEGTLRLGSGLPEAAGGLTLALADPAAALAFAGLSPLPLDAGTLDDLAFDGTLDVSEAALSVDAALRVTRNGVPINMTLDVAGEEGWLTTRAFLADAGADIGDLARVRFNGSIAVADRANPEIVGDISAASGNGRAAFASLIGSPPDLPEGTFEVVSVNGRLQVSGTDQIRIDAATFVLDDARATGDIAVDFSGERPRITGDLDTGPLVLDPFLPTERADRATASAAAADEGWGTAPLPLELLGLADAAVSLDVEKLTAGRIVLGKAGVDLALENGSLQADLREASAFGGRLNAIIGANAASRTVSLNGSFDAIRIEEMLVAVADGSRLSGTGTMAMDLAGDGTSVAALMGSLDGALDIRLADGALRGINLSELITNFTSLGAATGADARTDFTSAGAAFVVTDGRMRTDDLSMIGPLVRLGGAGSIDLGGRSISMWLVPRFVASLQGQGASGDEAGFELPVVVEGPWSDVRFRPDMDALPAMRSARDRVEGAAAAARDNARERAEDAIDEQADQLRQRLEQSNPLRDLFNR